MTEEELANPPKHLLRGTPWCYAKQSVVGGYTVTSVQAHETSTGQNPGWLIQLALYDGNNYFGPDVSNLTVDVTFETDARLRVKITDASSSRWEIPESILPLAPVNTTINVDALNYDFSWTTKPFGFAVTRLEDGEVIFNSTTPHPQLDGTPLFNGLVFTEQYIEISTQLPNQPSIYGLGEKVTSLMLATNGNPITFWSRDAASPPDQNIYGNHPFYLENRRTVSGPSASASTKTHGVWLRNSNGMDVLIHDEQTALTQHKERFGETVDESQEDNQWGFMTYRVIGGVLDFFIYVPAPSQYQAEAVTREYHTSVGFPHMPPCRWGYSSLSAVESMVSSYAKAGLPLDTAWTDIDYMQNYEDFTTDSVNFPADEMAQFIGQLAKQGQHYVVIIDPAIQNRTGYAPFESGIQQDVFVRQSSGAVFIGKVWPGYTAFPSWWSDSTSAWWQQNIVDFRNTVPVAGLWIDMNEASNFCTGDCDTPTGMATAETDASRSHAHAVATESVHPHRHRARHGASSKYHSSTFAPNNPPYRINNGGDGNPLNTLTLDADAVHGQGWIEYDVHNMYGLGESIATNAALESSMNTRSLVISRSTFSGSGKHTGHWLGDNWSTFQSMSYSIAGILAMNFFGIPLVGADICGFNGNTNEELCARWMALGSFYPFARNHNSKGEISQEPYTWSSVAAVSKLTLGARYSLLHVYNTLFFKANQNGGTVARPLFFEFANDQTTWAIETQFMIGSSIMITPVLTAGATTVQAYFPQTSQDGSHRVWYDWWTSAPLVVPSTGYLTLSAPTSTIPVHIAGGTILPLQTPALNTVTQATNPFQIVIAQDSNSAAQGELFLDDGLTLDIGNQSLQAAFSYASGTLDYTLDSNTYQPASTLVFNEIRLLGVSSTPSSVLVNGVATSSFTVDSTNQFLTINVNLALNQPFNAKINF